MAIGQEDGGFSFQAYQVGKWPCRRSASNNRLSGLEVDVHVHVARVLQG
jgi:hypothetical protein